MEYFTHFTPVIGAAISFFLLGRAYQRDLVENKIGVRRPVGGRK